MIVMKEDDIDHDDWVGVDSSTNLDLEILKDSRMGTRGSRERETVNSSSS